MSQITKIQIIPMFDKDNYKDWLQLQEKFFCGILPNLQNCKFYYPKEIKTLRTGTLCLFQFRNRIVASAVLEAVEKVDPPKDGLCAALLLDKKTIQIFEPITIDEIKKIDEKIRRFGQPKHIIPLEKLPLVQNLIDSRIVNRKTNISIDGLTTLMNFQAEYNEKEKEARKLSHEETKERALKAAKKPACQTVTTTVYRRDEYVAKYAYDRANGICQLCKQPAPFDKKCGMPYLESHHIVWLSKGGEDTIVNTIALCPNCHKKMHVLDEEEDRLKLSEVAKINNENHFTKH